MGCENSRESDYEAERAEAIKKKQADLGLTRSAPTPEQREHLQSVFMKLVSSDVVSESELSKLYVTLEQLKLFQGLAIS